MRKHISIREGILQGLATCPVLFTEEDVRAIEKKLETRAMKNPSGYAYMTARNWAISKQRREAVHAREKAQQLLAEERREQERREFDKARIEFLELVATLAPTLNEHQIRYCGMVRLVCFEHATDAECAERFPGTNRTLRYQWKCRGLRMLRTHASPTLLRVLNWRTWSKNQ